ncbi:MAG: diacylglycerol kinase [Bdellovibrionales bacterium]
MNDKPPVPENNKGIKRLINAFKFSMAGFRSCFKTEEAFRQELFLLIIATPLALWLGDTGVERALLIGAIFLVMITELLNSAVERVVDRISFEKHELSKEAKDIGSAAVLLSLICASCIWGLVLLS